MQNTEVTPLLLEANSKLLEETPLLLATGSKVKMSDLDEDKKAKTNVVAHKVIMSLARGTFYGRLID